MLSLSHFKIGPARKLVSGDIPGLTETQQRIIAIINSKYSPSYNVCLYLDEEGNVYGIDNYKLIYMEHTGRVASGYMYGFVNEKVFIVHEILLATGGRVRANNVQKWMAMSFEFRKDEAIDIPLPCDNMGVPLVIQELKKQGIVNDSIIEQLKLKYAEKDLPEIEPLKRTAYELIVTCLNLIGDRDISTAVTFHLELYQVIFSNTIENIEYAKTQTNEEILFAEAKASISGSAGSGEAHGGESEDDEDFPSIEIESKPVEVSVEPEEDFPEASVEEDHTVKLVKAAKKIFNATEVRQESAPMEFRKKGIKK